MYIKGFSGVYIFSCYRYIATEINTYALISICDLIIEHTDRFY